MAQRIANRPDGVEHWSGATLVDTVDFTLDVAGRRTRLSDPTGNTDGFYDVNDNCYVDYDDLSLMYTQYGFTAFQQGFNPRYDLNSDGVINYIDTGAAQNQLGRSCPQFTYDADGNLMKLEGPKNMVYIGGIYEKNLDTGEVTKYYAADGRRIAMRKGASLYYFANDHLGSTSLVMDASGNMVSQTRYYPYGNVWTQSATAQTDRLFTGQRRYGANSGIYYYGSRFYSADVGRFLQPDTIVPGTENPQALNRYSYVLNNPLTHNDPTGHCVPDINCPGDYCNRNPECGQPAGPPGGGGHPAPAPVPAPRDGGNRPEQPRSSGSQGCILPVHAAREPLLVSSLLQPRNTSNPDSLDSTDRR